MTPIERVLDGLPSARHYGNGWRCDCPNPVHKRGRGSLSIRESEDGGVLLHCFACMDTPAILGALGLEASDLFPPRGEASPEQRKRDLESLWAAALNVLDTEAWVVRSAGRLAQTAKLNRQDAERLELAIRRIDNARRVFRLGTKRSIDKDRARIARPARR